MAHDNINPNELGVFYKSSEKVRCLVCNKVVTGWNLAHHKDEKCVSTLPMDDFVSKAAMKPLQPLKINKWVKTDV